MCTVVGREGLCGDTDVTLQTCPWKGPGRAGVASGYAVCVATALPVEDGSSPPRFLELSPPHAAAFRGSSPIVALALSAANSPRPLPSRRTGLGFRT